MNTTASYPPKPIAAATPAANPLPAMQITNWPLRDDSAKCLIAAAAIVGIGFAVAMATTPPWGVCASALCVVSLWRVWVPVRFELDARGIQQILPFSRSFRPWTSVVAFRKTPAGVLLLNDDDAMPLSAMCGLFIAATPSQLDELIGLIECYQAAKMQTARLSQASHDVRTATVPPFVGSRVGASAADASANKGSEVKSSSGPATWSVDNPAHGQ